VLARAAQLDAEARGLWPAGPSRSPCHRIALAHCTPQFWER
jgi:hypothetical protein